MGKTKTLIYTLAITMLVATIGVQAQLSRINERQVGPLLQRLETNTDAFSTAVERQLDNGRVRNAQREENVRDYLEAFENATDELRSNFNDRRAQNSDVSNVLNYGWYINDFMSRNRLNAATTRQWNMIRTDLNTLARLYNVSWNWNQQLPAFSRGPVQGQMIRVDERQVRPILQRLETNTDAFRSTVERQMNNRRNNVRMDENALAYIEAFEKATDDLRNGFNGHTVQNSDVTAVMNYGWYVNDFMNRNRVNAPAVQQWNQIRNDLNLLSRLYNVSWNWNQTLPAFSQTQGQSGSQQYNQLDGTYRLNVGASDNVSAVISQTIRNTSVRAQQQANLERRMASPDTIVIQTRGNQVRFATDYGQPVDFVADGRAVTETNNRGQQVRTTVSITNNTLSIMTDGDRANDFRVSFTPVAGNRLRVTRQLYIENQNEMITVNSVYDRTTNVAQWPNQNNQPTWNNTNTGAVGNFYIPNGTQITAVLQNQIATNVSQAGDQFSMEVTSPNQYRGAIITGRIAQAESSGRVSGRANLSMVFDTIQFRNQTYQFAGIIDSAREADGSSININNEGTARDGNQTTQTVTRAGIGAVLGALIGAIAGGGQGAAIGAGVGAGVGAGSVLVQGRDNLRLEAGSQFMITSTGPNTNNN